jgi:hypothetical protein
MNNIEIKLNSNQKKIKKMFLSTINSYSFYKFRKEISLENGLLIDIQNFSKKEINFLDFYWPKIWIESHKKDIKEKIISFCNKNGLNSDILYRLFWDYIFFEEIPKNLDEILFFSGEEVEFAFFENQKNESSEEVVNRFPIVLRINNFADTTDLISYIKDKEDQFNFIKYQNGFRSVVTESGSLMKRNGYILKLKFQGKTSKEISELVYKKFGYKKILPEDIRKIISKKRKPISEYQTKKIQKMKRDIKSRDK